MGILHRIGRRALRQTRRFMGGRHISFVYHPSYEYVLQGEEYDPTRGQRILAFLYDEGLISASDITRPGAATFDQISRVHSPAYLESLCLPEMMEAVLGYRIEEDRWEELIDAQRTAAGGTIEAVRLALRTGGVVANLCGGFHHASPDRGGGFCVLNDVAIAVAWARSQGFDEPVLIIDLDIHDGNGTRAAFSDDPTTHTFSIHNDTWDSQPAVADTSVALGSVVPDDLYLETLKCELSSTLESQQPGLVLYIAGTDVAKEDTLGNWEISARGLLMRDKHVINTVRAMNRTPPMVILTGGGYGDRAWWHSARLFGWLLSGRTFDPSEDIDAIVKRFRRIETEASAVAANSREVRGDPDWTLSEEDFQLILPPENRATKVLGEYSRNGIELALERVGILKQVRAKGYAHPTVTVQAPSSLGHTIRMHGDADRQELLMELRLRRDCTTMAGMEFLYAEWLLLQDPRKRFQVSRPRLPGQEHPGLGLLAEIVALLVVMCERLGLDGIAFVPAHYYMAALGRRHLVFIRPSDAVVYTAMRRAVRGLPLAEASSAVEEGRVVDASTGETVAWHAPLMILPVNQALRNRLSSAEEEEVAVPELELVTEK